MILGMSFPVFWLVVGIYCFFLFGLFPSSAAPLFGLAAVITDIMVWLNFIPKTITQTIVFSVLSFFFLGLGYSVHLWILRKEKLLKSSRKPLQGAR